MRVLVTGSRGRIGTYVVREFAAAGHDVTGIDILPGKGGSRVDLTDAGQVYQAVAGCEAVVHMGAWANAGIVPDTRTYGDNVQGTYNVLQACAHLGVGRVVSASSAQVYGLAAAPPVYVPLDEEHPVRPVNSYALSKVAGEQAAEYFTRTHGLTVLAFRLMGIRTPGDMDAQIETLAGAPASGAGLLWTRTDTRDVALACRLAIEADDVEAGVYNITGPRVVINEPSRELVERYCGDGVEFRGDLTGYASPMSCARAGRAFGYRPRYDWSVDQRFSE